MYLIKIDINSQPNKATSAARLAMSGTEKVNVEMSEKYETRRASATTFDPTTFDPEPEQVEAFIAQMEAELHQDPSESKGRSCFTPTFANARHFTWVMAAFASMGGLLFGLDQSLISGANLFMPADLNLTSQQVGFVNSSVPLGAVVGAILISPANEYFGRRKAIMLATILYTIGAVLEAGAVDYAMMILGRLILGFGVGLETGTVPVYVAESVPPTVRGNLVSLYQFNIALGEVFGYVVAAIFLKVPGNWRYMLGSSVVFSTIMFVGYVAKLIACRAL